MLKRTDTLRSRLMRRSAPALICAAFCCHICLAADTPAKDIAAWVESRGGRITTDQAGRIAGIDLSYTWISDADLDRIAGLKDLRSLDLSFVRVTDRGMERLRGLTNIERMSLHSAEHITDFALTYLRDWKNLRWLDLSGTDITDIGIEILSGFNSLESLNVSVTQATDNGIEFLTALPRLRELKIGGNVMTAGALMALRVLPKLVSLDVSGTQRRNSGVWQVSFTDLDLALFSSFERLEELNLRGRKITDLGMVHLARMKNLRTLDLSETGVTSDGIERITGLNLRQIKLSDLKRVDDRSIAHLLRIKMLESIDLSGTSVSDAGLQKLADATNLRQIFVGGSKVSKEAAQLFQKDRPQMQVSWWEPPKIAPPPPQPAKPGPRPQAAGQVTEKNQ
jgi:Leucine Rich Repeat (LRR) protein